MGVQLVNQSSTRLDLPAMAAALTYQQKHHLATAWHISNPQTVSVTTHNTYYKCFLVDSIPEAPNALAYHDVGSDGIPYIRLGVDVCKQAGVEVSSVVSHEVCELAVDEYCAQWAMSLRRKFNVAYEACDPVEASSYLIEGVEVSNFVTPWYFVEDDKPHKWDYLGHLTAPFSLEKGGYLIVMRPGAESQLTAETIGEMRPELAEAKAKSRGRTFWRKVDVAVAQ